MGNLLLYKDVIEAVKDIEQHPNAETISDFINNWASQYEEPNKTAFLFALRQAIYLHIPSIVSENDLSLVDNCNLIDFSGYASPQLHFASVFIEKIIGEENGYTFKEDIRSSKTGVEKYQTISFNMPIRNKATVANKFTRINNIVSLVAKDDEELFIETIFSKNIKSVDYKIVFCNDTKIVTYLLDKIAAECSLSAFKASILDQTKIFYKQGGEKLHAQDIYSARSYLKNNGLLYKEEIDRVFSIPLYYRGAG